MAWANTGNFPLDRLDQCGQDWAMDKTNPIRVRREALGLTPPALAARLDVTERTVRRWEKGERFPRPSDLCKLEAVLGVTLNDLVRASVTAAPDTKPEAQVSE